MSQDGKAQRITVDFLDGSTGHMTTVKCGGYINAHGGRYRNCDKGHLHCSLCGRQARRFRKGISHVCKIR
jgi:hypothetical protein